MRGSQPTRSSLAVLVLGTLALLLPASGTRQLLAQDDDIIHLPSSDSTGGIRASLPNDYPYLAMASRSELPDELRDPAFDRFVDLRLLGQAWGEMDPALLTDVALQMADAERVLLRPRRGISADTLFELAVRAAQSGNDKAALERLTKAVEGRSDALQTQVAAATTLADASRGESPMMLPLDTDPEVFAACKMMVDQIGRAKVRGDAAMLDNLSRSLEEIDIFKDPHTSGLKELIARARQQIAPASPLDSQLATTLDLLADSSRYPAGRDLDEREGPAEPLVRAHDPRIELPRFGSRGSSGESTSFSPPDGDVSPLGETLDARSRSLGERIVWRHDGGFFENTRGNDWFEKSRNGTYRFREARRTESYIELDSTQANYRVRLYANRCTILRGNADAWEVLYPGGWETPADQPPIGLIPGILDPLYFPARSDSPLAAGSRQWGLSDWDPTNRKGGLRQGLRDFDRERLKMQSTSPRPGRDYTKVYIRNRTNDRVAIAVRLHPYEAPHNHSELKYYEPNASKFQTRAWYTLSPGQRMHIANTANIHVYVYAQSGSRRWSGNHNVEVYDNGQRRTVGFKPFYINAPYAEEHTININ